MIALAAGREDWAVGDAEATWWSRVGRPARHTWTAGEPCRLGEQPVATDDPDPKALACSGLRVRRGGGTPAELWRRCVEGRPVSALPAHVLGWCGERGAVLGLTTLLLVWDHAPWHVRQAGRRGLRAHHQRALRAGGVRRMPCFLPSKSPWLTPIEPKGGHAKRRGVEPARRLTARDLEDRVCAALAVPPLDHLAIPQEVA